MCVLLLNESESQGIELRLKPCSWQVITRANDRARAQTHAPNWIFK